ncbi:MAG: zinc-dependent metalloprotease [Bdellovibrionales bacterium]|nr:zinc-dependent metalloprotease [Bdellovibrionales bacterium]
MMMKRIFDLNRRCLPILAFTMAIFAVGCTKVREAKFPEGAGENIFEISLFTKSDLSLQTDSDASLSQFSKPMRKLRVSQQQSKVQVRDVRAPEALRSMFKGLEISAVSNKTYPVQFKLDRQILTAYRVVDDLSELSIQERELVEKSSAAKNILPLFQYRVQGYGRVVRAVNDLGEETSTLRMKPTEWKEATHVQISTLPEDRILVAPANQDQAERVFVRERLDGQIFSRSELESELDIRVAREGWFRAVIDGSELLLQEVLSINDQSLTSAQRDLIAAQDRGGPVSAEVSRCGSEVSKLLASEASLSEKDCVRISRYRVSISHVEAKRRSMDAEGTLSAEVEFRQVAKASRLVQIPKDPLVAEVGTSSLDSRRSIRVADASKWEFFFRRTIEDSPNSFDYTFAGSSGPLELVRMIFEKDRLRIVRADAMIPTKGNTRVDLDDLMSLPVQYFREEKTDAQGNALASPRVIPSDSGHPDAVAYVSWEGNSVPPVSSALNYYELGQCFAGATDTTVSAVDNRMSSDGIVSFSVNTTYMNNPGTDCGGVMSAGYFDQVQASFTFQERISIKKYAQVGSDKGDLEKPLVSVPYEAQKKLGFGLFTYKKNSPNSYGNIGDEGTVTPLPAIFDINKGRKIRYVLAGLPTDSSDAETRRRLITATREVIQDWNDAFRKALKGTPMEREGDVLELLVEGEDKVAPAALGDLDVNHIYYIPKKTSSGVIGLGGAHSSPRSGRVAAASVFIYGGNIHSYVESIRELKKAKAQFIKELSSPLVSSSAPIGGASGQSLVVEHSPLKLQSSGVNSSDRAKSEPKEMSRLLGKIGNRAFKSAEMTMDERLGSLSKMPRKPVELAFYESFAQGVKEGVLGNSRRMQHLVDQKLVEVLSGRVPPRALETLRLQAKRAEVISKFFDNMSKANVCLQEAPDLTLDLLEADVSDVDLAIGVYKPTLAHEIGHNLGLRHNFMGSFDKANWKFDPSDKSERDYSSIMDYLASDEHYDGLAPQDIAAIRAAYAGRLETNAGELISLEDVKKRAGVSSWSQLTSEQVRSVGVKSFLFCSDEDAGVSPVCNRFDRGTTPAEIVGANIADYRQLYNLRNFAGNKLAFSVSGTGGYTGRLFARFLPIRQFLEETIHQAVNGAEGVVINSYAEAALAGLDFFHSVVRSPDAPDIAQEQERVMAATIKDGRTVKVERKWLRDVRLEKDSDRLRIRGVEFDKVIALLMLTERQLGLSRYESQNLRFSYPEFERLVFRDVKSPLELPTIGLLQELLTNDLKPAGVVLDDQGNGAGIIGLDPRFKSEVTDMMRTYAMLAGAVFQDVDGLEAKDNGSRLFRVMSSFHPRSGIQAVVRPGASSKDRDQLKYWAPEDSIVAKQLIDRLQMLEQVATVRDQLGSIYVGFLAKKQELAAAENADVPDGSKVEALKQELAAIEKSGNDLLSTLPDSAGLKNMSGLVTLVTQVISAAEALDQAKATYDPKKFALALEQRHTQIGRLMKGNPALAALLGVVAETQGVPRSLSLIISGVSNESERGIVFSNIEMLNRLLVAAHPEFKR